MYKKLVGYAALVGITLFIVNALAVVFYWYDSMWWFDMPMHTLGGIFVALGGTAVMFKHLRGHTSFQLFVTITLFVFVVGLAWEYYEYIVQFYIKSVHLADIADSISDLICDMVGGSIGALFVILLNKQYNQR